ncbi:MAG: GGDEF domain-containing protein [Actinomycetota bacterium]|nr:GGDEF domain-containing protein [Actinomycetota bacterium]
MPTSPSLRASQCYGNPSAAAGPDPVAAGEFNLITSRITVRTGAEVGLLTVFNETEGLVHVLGACGAARGGRGLPVLPRAGGGFVARVLESGRSAGTPIDPRRDHSLGTPRSGARITYPYAAIRAELDREIRRCERHGRDLSCCFIDLNHFKRVNDRHGHLCGNRVLAHVGATLRDGVRVGDSIGRYGGDEFLAILPDADEAAALALGDRLRTKIFTTRPKGSDERVDTSIGVAQWWPGSTADDLLGAADAALLRAKGVGGGIVAGAGRDAAWGAATAR